MNAKKTINIAVFLSGTGSNTEQIIRSLKKEENVNVSLLLSNKPENGAKRISDENGIKLISFNKTILENEQTLINELQSNKIDFIVLAGFLLKIPSYLVEAYPNKIINIHPALLPKYGGKGMYGKHVHKAVYEKNEKETGITIHYVNENYDEGNIIAQFKVDLNENDTPETIEQKVRALEKEHFAPTIEKLLSE